MRFRLISDREGYSPGFFKRMAAQRIACQTYHKYPGDDWPENEFSTQQVPLPSPRGGGGRPLKASRINLLERG